MRRNIARHSRQGTKRFSKSKGHQCICCIQFWGIKCRHLANNSCYLWGQHSLIRGRPYPGRYFPASKPLLLSIPNTVKHRLHVWARLVTWLWLTRGGVPLLGCPDVQPVNNVMAQMATLATLHTRRKQWMMVDKYLPLLKDFINNTIFTLQVLEVQLFWINPQIPSTYPVLSPTGTGEKSSLSTLRRTPELESEFLN